MYLSVQHAARLLGVSTHTIRRWTASGFLPCTRTAGGHRRIRREDVEELAQAIGGSNHLAAKQAREREVETLVETATAVVGQLDLTELLKEIARRLTSLLECHFCAISTYDAEAHTVTILADYSDKGERLPNMAPYDVSRYPLTGRVLEERVTAVVNVTDSRADPAEVADLRRDGDKSLLLLPLVFGERSIGLLELVDHVRERHYTRQELRLCRAIAGQAAVALHNAEAFAQLRRSTDGVTTMVAALDALADEAEALFAAPSSDRILTDVAHLACRVTGAASCVATHGALTAGSRGEMGSSIPDAARVRTQDSRELQSGPARVVVVPGPESGADLALTVSLLRPPVDGEEQILRLVAALGAAALMRPRPVSGPS